MNNFPPFTQLQFSRDSRMNGLYLKKSKSQLHIFNFSPNEQFSTLHAVTIESWFQDERSEPGRLSRDAGGDDQVPGDAGGDQAHGSKRGSRSGEGWDVNPTWPGYFC